MRYLENLVSLEGTMFLMILLGILCVRTKIITEIGRREITGLVINVVLPCYILDCFISNIGAFSFGNIGLVAVASILLQCATILLSHVLFRKVDPSQRTILKYAIIVSNAGFLGFPLVSSVFGDEGLIMASIFLIFQRINSFSVALSFFTSSGRGTFLRRTLTHPCILSTFIGVAIMYFELPPPQLVCSVLSSIGKCSTPISMLLIGMVLSGTRSGKPVDGLTLRYSALRLVLIPAGMFLLCRAMGMGITATGTSVLLSAMPAGTMSVMLSIKYGGDTLFASRLVVFTTILSLATIPLWCLLCIS